MTNYYKHKQTRQSGHDIQLYIHKTKAISLRINPIILKEFDAECHECNSSRSAIIDQLIRKWLSDRNVRIELKNDNINIMSDEMIESSKYGLEDRLT